MGVSVSAGRIVLTTIGSLGDLHPYIALAAGLVGRGHRVVLATSPSYRQRVESAGVEFAPVGPDTSEFGDEAQLMARIMHQRKGPEFVIREMVIPFLKRTYDELAPLVADADVIVTHPLTMSGFLLAEQRLERTRWVSVALAPSSFWSAYDPPVLAPMPWLSKLRWMGPGLFKPLNVLMRWSVSHWTRPWHDLRRELGLPKTRRQPLFDGQYSPHLTLGLFSKYLAEPQKDWPVNTIVSGFLFPDSEPADKAFDPQLERYLEAGEAPVVFTLGSSAVMNAGDFYAQSAAAAIQLGCRAVLLVGQDPRNRPAGRLPDTIFTAEYADYARLFPRARAIVHQGGIGTTAQALRSGRPMLVMPFGFDQFDNAARVARLGVARLLNRHKYSANIAARELNNLLNDPVYAQNAKAVGEQVNGENGLNLACQAVEGQLALLKR